jgi:hypothetical protein
MSYMQQTRLLGRAFCRRQRFEGSGQNDVHVMLGMNTSLPATLFALG